MTVSILDYALPDPVVFSQAASKQVAPRSTIVVLGRRVLPVEWHVDLSTFGIADTATVVVPVTGNPDWSVSLKSADWNDPVPIEIYAGFPAIPGTAPTLDGMIRIFLGQIDQYTVEFHADECRFQARSFAASLVDDKITTFATGGAPQFPGQILITSGMTTDAFLTAVAKQYGLTLDIERASGSKALLLSEIYARNYMVGLQNLAPWDIIKTGAQIEDMQVWVDSNNPANDGTPTLHYVTPAKVPQQIKSMQYGYDLKTFTGTHSPTFNKNVLVRVRTYNPETKESYTVRTAIDSDTGEITKVNSALTKALSIPVFGTNMSTRLTSSVNPATGALNTAVTNSVKSGGAKTGTYNAAAPSKSTKQTYTLRYPNLTQDQADYVAKVVASIISRHEFSGAFSFAVTPDLLPYLNVRTLWFISGLPWDSFNTPQGPQAPAPLASSNPIVQNVLGQLQNQDPTWSSAAYRTQTLSISFSTPQGEDGGGTGFEASISGPNHPIIEAQ